MVVVLGTTMLARPAPPRLFVEILTGFAAPLAQGIYIMLWVGFFARQFFVRRHEFTVRAVSTAMLFTNSSSKVRSALAALARLLKHTSSSPTVNGLFLATSVGGESVAAAAALGLLDRTPWRVYFMWPASLAPPGFTSPKENAPPPAFARTRSPALLYTAPSILPKFYPQA